MGRKIVIASTGTETLSCIDGKVYGEHVKRIEFSHTGGLIAEIRLAVNYMVGLKSYDNSRMEEK